MRQVCRAGEREGGGASGEALSTHLKQLAAGKPPKQQTNKSCFLAHLKAHYTTSKGAAEQEAEKEVKEERGGAL